VNLFNRELNVTIHYSKAIHISVPSKKVADYPSHRLRLINTSRKCGSSVPGHGDDHLCTEPPPKRFNELHFLVRISGTEKKVKTL
jgi:hypothetical protein